MDKLIQNVFDPSDQTAVCNVYLLLDITFSALVGGTVAVYSTVCPRSTDDWESIVVIDNTIFLFQGIWLIQDGKVRPGTLSTMATIIID